MEENFIPSEWYGENISLRKDYEDRAKKFSELTLPYIIREGSDNGGTSLLDSSSQSYGGRLVNTLTSKMGMALLPPSTSSFRYVPNPEELMELTEGNKNNIAKINQLLSQQASTINTELELQQIRTSLFSIIRQLQIVGCVLVEKVAHKGVRLHNLQSFVVELDAQGHPLKICFVEKLKELPKGIVVLEEKDEYEIYTMLYKQYQKDSWRMIQDIDGIIVGEEATYKSYDDMPFRYLGWTWIEGDSYHRPFVEDYYQDLQQVDKLAKLLTDGAIIAAKNILFVNERGGRTRKVDVAKSANGDVIDGSSDDVTFLTTQKSFDFNFVAQREGDLKRELAAAFLMNEAATRQAERVTAYEISYLAQELESSSLAGIYSQLSLQWSRWIIQQVMSELGIKFDTITIKILTGLDALGRSQEAQKLDRFIQRLGSIGKLDWLNDEELVQRYAAYEGLDQVQLIKTPDEVAQLRQQQQQAAIMQQAAPSIMEQAAASQQPQQTT